MGAVATVGAGAWNSVLIGGVESMLSASELLSENADFFFLGDAGVVLGAGALEASKVFTIDEAPLSASATILNGSGVEVVAAGITVAALSFEEELPSEWLSVRDFLATGFEAGVPVVDESLSELESIAKSAFLFFATGDKEDADCESTAVCGDDGPSFGVK